MHAPQSMRDEFEAWIKSGVFAGISDAGPYDAERDRYAYFPVHMAWLACQAFTLKEREACAALAESRKDIEKEAELLAKFADAERSGDVKSAVSLGSFWATVGAVNGSLQSLAAAIRGRDKEPG